MSKTTDVVRASLQKRYAAEKRFRLYGLAGILISLGFLFFLLITIVFRSAPAFKSSEIKKSTIIDKPGCTIRFRTPQITLISWRSMCFPSLFLFFILKMTFNNKLFTWGETEGICQ